MNDSIVQNILKNKINYSIFNLDILDESQIEMVYFNLKSKINNKNAIFEKMLNKEQIKQIFNFETNDIINDKLEILQLDHLKNIDITNQIINKHYNILSKLTNDYDVFTNKKTVIIMIQYLLSENIYSIDDIIKIIKNTINVSELTYKFLDDSIVVNLNDFICSLKLSEKNDSVNYINKLTKKQYIQMKEIIKNTDDNTDLIEIISQPYIDYYFNKSEKFVSADLVYNFLDMFIKDKNETNKNITISKIVDIIIKDNNILNIALNKKDISIISKYLFILRNFKNDKLNNFRKEITILKNKKINEHTTEKDNLFAEHKEHIIIPSVDGKKSKIIIDLLYTAELFKLKNFLNELSYNKKKINNIISKLNLVNIKTYYKLEKLVLNNKFIKLCRQNEKILPGKVIKLIIYKILDDNNKLELLEKHNISINNIDILNLQFQKFSISHKKSTNINDIKKQRSNLYNLILLLKENDEDVSIHKKELNKLDNQIKNYYINLDADKLINENIDEINDLMKNMTLNTNEKIRLNDIMNKYKNEINNQKDIFGHNFKKEEKSKNVFNNFDSKLTDIINKFEKEENQIEKEERKKHFNELQQELVNNYLKNFLEKIDYKYNTNMIKYFSTFSNFLKYKINQTIIPTIYKNFKMGDKFNRNESVYHNLKNIIHTFVIMFKFLNKNINYDQIYNNIDNIITNNKDIKKVFIKSNGKETHLIDQNDKYVTVDYLGQELKLKNDEVFFLNDLSGKEIKVIKGVNKGQIGIVYNQKDDFVLATKDLYGKSLHTDYIPRVSFMKLKYDEFKINEIKEKQDFIIDNVELYNYFKNQNKTLYAITKFEINKYIKTIYLDNFDEIFKLCVSLINEYKINEFEKYQTLKNYKQEYIQLKKDISDNKNNKRKYIILNKKIRKLHNTIKDLNTDMKDVKDTLINNSNNINPNYSYEKINNLYNLNEKIIKKQVKKVNKKKLNRKEKNIIQKELKNKLFNDINQDITNLLSTLL